jgi:hypothetical protein
MFILLILIINNMELANHLSVGTLLLLVSVCFFGFLSITYILKPFLKLSKMKKTLSRKYTYY